MGTKAKPAKKTKKRTKLKPFRVETFDGGSYLNFLTMARNHKEALTNMLERSTDYKTAHDDMDTTIKITEVKSKKKAK